MQRLFRSYRSFPPVTLYLEEYGVAANDRWIPERSAVKAETDEGDPQFSPNAFLSKGP
jgi:hypothetical protein